MKRILATGSIAAFAMLGFAGTANAAEPNCFGQIHKAVNQGAVDTDNVGQFVQTLEGKGQEKKATVYAVFCS